MADLGISISLNSTQYTQGLSQVTAQTNAAAQNINKSLNTVSNAANEGGKAMQAFTSNLGGLGNLLGGGLVVGAATLAAQAITSLVGSIVDLGKESIQVASDVQTVNRALAFTAGSAEEGAASYDRFKDVANGLGISIEKNQRAFKNFVVSATQSGQTLGQAETEFRQVATAITAMGLSAEDSNGVLLALGQIASKGTVQAEELRGQIGERLPGAFAIAARSIGVTESKLNDMLKQGEVVSKDFLPKFTQELERTFGSTAQQGIDSYSAQLNIFDNQLFELKNTLGQQLIPAMIDFLKAGTEIINIFGGAENVIGGFITTLKSMFGILVNGFQVLKGFGGLLNDIGINTNFAINPKAATTGGTLGGIFDFLDNKGFEDSKIKIQFYKDAIVKLKEAQKGQGVIDFAASQVRINDYENELKKLTVTTNGLGTAVSETAKKLKEIPQAGSLGDLENQLKAINDTFQNKTGFDVAKLTGRKEDLEAQIKRLKELYGLVKTVPEAAAGSLSALQKQLSELNKQLSENPKDFDLFVGLQGDIIDTEKKIKDLQNEIKKAKRFAETGGIFTDIFGVSAGALPKQGQIAPAEIDILSPRVDTGGIDTLINKFDELNKSINAPIQKLQDFKKELGGELLNSAGAAFESLGKGLGEVATGAKDAGEVFQQFVKDTLSAVFVTAPRLIGLNLLKEALTTPPPLSWAMVAGGIALLGISGIAAGLIGNIGQNNQQSIANQTASAGQIGGTGATAQATAQGLGSNSAANTQAITNVTVVLNTNGILTALEKQQYINGLLTGG